MVLTNNKLETRSRSSSVNSLHNAFAFVLIFFALVFSILRATLLFHNTLRGSWYWTRKNELSFHSDLRRNDAKSVTNNHRYILYPSGFYQCISVCRCTITWPHVYFVFNRPQGGSFSSRPRKVRGIETELHVQNPRNTCHVCICVDSPECCWLHVV